METKKIISAGLMITAIAGSLAWTLFNPSSLPEGVVETNGRLEAEQVEVATKTAGRIAEVLVSEGQMVAAGDLLVRIDNQQLLAKKREAEAQIAQAQLAAEEAAAAVSQRQSQLKLANTELKRAQTLFKQKVAPQDKLDQAEAQQESASAALRLAQATEKRTQASIEAARAGLQELQSLLDDTEIYAPRNGRVQYVLAQPGEVLAAGGRVITLLDVSEVYMTIFLPAIQVGKLGINDEARLILDPIPEYVVPARVSFIAGDAQFTPKSVETSEERNNLMFRVKLSIDPQLLKRHEEKVKTGVRGSAYVRTDTTQEWPANLAVHLP
ncbi:MAG: HlyD family efflux transporter periplasmic adaptor subunit [Saccharospirillaceae bacterium]|nr:HlyD family efflux transporter periplasmic adaptor subunit [Saccharospirillaceae bacterium]MCD8529821.1 HlyD family efflux transporter periplasmic adaptor subunit [Saccharospirillaceae bacterium]